MATGTRPTPSAASARRGGSAFGLFVLGVVLGAGLALLYAPQSGDETRRAIGRGAKRARRRAAELAESTADSAREMARDAREALERRLARHHGRPAAARRVDDDDEVDGV